MKWTKTPNGAEQAVLVGDPTKAGLYVVRVKFPAGLKTPIHFHPDTRVATVLSGTAYVGYGEEYDDKTMKALPPGSIWTEPPKQLHYNWAKDGEVVFHVVGTGPTATTPFKKAQ